MMIEFRYGRVVERAEDGTVGVVIGGDAAANVQVMPLSGIEMTVPASALRIAAYAGRVAFERDVQERIRYGESYARAYVALVGDDASVYRRDVVRAADPGRLAWSALCAAAATDSLDMGSWVTSGGAETVDVGAYARGGTATACLSGWIALVDGLRLNVEEEHVILADGLMPIKEYGEKRLGIDESAEGLFRVDRRRVAERLSRLFPRPSLSDLMPMIGVRDHHTYDAAPPSRPLPGVTVGTDIWERRLARVEELDGGEVSVEYVTWRGTRRRTVRYQGLYDALVDVSAFDAEELFA